MSKHTVPDPGCQCGGSVGNAKKAPTPKTHTHTHIQTISRGRILYFSTRVATAGYPSLLHLHDVGAQLLRQGCHRAVLVWPVQGQAVLDLRPQHLPMETKGPGANLADRPWSLFKPETRSLNLFTISLVKGEDVKCSETFTQTLPVDFQVKKGQLFGTQSCRPYCRDLRPEEAERCWRPWRNGLSVGVRCQLESSAEGWPILGLK